MLGVEFLSEPIFVQTLGTSNSKLILHERVKLRAVEYDREFLGDQEALVVDFLPCGLDIIIGMDLITSCGGAKILP